MALSHGYVTLFCSQNYATG